VERGVFFYGATESNGGEGCFRKDEVVEEVFIIWVRDLHAGEGRRDCDRLRREVADWGKMVPTYEKWPEKTNTRCEGENSKEGTHEVAPGRGSGVQ